MQKTKTSEILSPTASARPTVLRGEAVADLRKSAPEIADEVVVQRASAPDLDADNAEVLRLLSEGCSRAPKIDPRLVKIHCARTRGVRPIISRARNELHSAVSGFFVCRAVLSIAIPLWK